MDNGELLVELQKLHSGQTSLKEKVGGVSDDLQNLTKTVRGSNGNPGLVTHSTLINARLIQVEKDICGLGDSIDRWHVDNGKSDSKKKTNPALTKEWLLDKLVYLVIVFIVWLALNVLPDVLQILPSAP